MLSLSFFACEEEEELRTPIGNWYRTEYYWVQSQEIDTIDTSDDEVYIKISDSTFIYYTVIGDLGGITSVTFLGCEIEGDRITTYNPIVDSAVVGVSEMQYFYSDDNLILESVTYPENHGDFRQTLVPYAGDLPPETIH